MILHRLSAQLLVNILIGVVKIELMPMVVMMMIMMDKMITTLVEVVVHVMGHGGPVELGCVGTSEDVGGSNPVAVGVLGDLHEGLAGGGGD